MSVVFDQVTILFLFALCGYALGKTKKADIGHTKLLSVLEVYVFLPATVFKTFSSNFTAAYIREKYDLILLSAVILAAVVAAARAGSRLLTGGSFERKVYQYSLTVPNYGYMGYALAESLFGSGALLNMMIFALPVSLYTYTAGFCLLTNAKLSLKRLLQPVILAIGAGCVVGLLGIEIPDMAVEILNKAAGCMATVSMLLTGLTIAEFPLKVLLRDHRLYLVSALRLLVIPCVIASALSLLGRRDTVMPALLLYAMPCGLNTIVFPRMVGENCETGAGLACISSTLACVTIPVCIQLFL